MDRQEDATSRRITSEPKNLGHKTQQVNLFFFCQAFPTAFFDKERSDLIVLLRSIEDSTRCSKAGYIEKRSSRFLFRKFIPLTQFILGRKRSTGNQTFLSTSVSNYFHSENSQIPCAHSQCEIKRMLYKTAHFI